MRLPLSSEVSSSQPTVRVVQPSPVIRRFRPARNTRASTQPLTVNTSDFPTPDPAVQSSNNFTASIRLRHSIEIDTPTVQSENSLEAEEHEEALACPICTITVRDNDQALFCEQCNTWYHSDCLFISEEEYFALSNSSDSWFCDHCRSIRANKLKWGTLDGECNISSAVKSAYQKVITWKKNIFSLPRGKCGSDFLKELTRLLCLFVDKTKWERLALPLVHIFVPIMLPS